MHLKAFAVELTGGAGQLDRGQVRRGHNPKFNMAVARRTDRYVGDQPVPCVTSGTFRPESRQIGKVDLIEVGGDGRSDLPCVALHRSVCFKPGRRPTFVTTKVYLQ